VSPRLQGVTVGVLPILAWLSRTLFLGNWRPDIKSYPKTRVEWLLVTISIFHESDLLICDSCSDLPTPAGSFSKVVGVIRPSWSKILCGFWYRWCVNMDNLTTFCGASWLSLFLISWTCFLLPARRGLAARLGASLRTRAPFRGSPRSHRSWNAVFSLPCLCSRSRYP